MFSYIEQYYYLLVSNYKFRFTVYIVRIKSNFQLEKNVKVKKNKTLHLLLIADKNWN